VPPSRLTGPCSRHIRARTHAAARLVHGNRVTNNFGIVNYARFPPVYTPRPCTRIKATRARTSTGVCGPIDMGFIFIISLKLYTDNLILRHEQIPYCSVRHPHCIIFYTRNVIYYAALGPSSTIRHAAEAGELAALVFGQELKDGPTNECNSESRTLPAK